MTLTITLQLLGGVLLLAANAFFVAIEFSLTRLRQYDEEEIKDDPSLKRAWEMTEKLEIHLTGCQVGITTTSILLGVIAEPGVTKLIQISIGTATLGSLSSHSISIVLSLVIINFVHTVWGEQAPTYLGVERAKQIARWFARPLHWWTMAIYPVLKAGDWLTKATLKVFGVTMTRSWTDEDGEERSGGEHGRATLKNEVANLVQKKGLSEERQQEIVKSVEMDEIPVRDITIPREQVHYLSTHKSFDENMEIIRDTMKNRYPLVGSDLDDFVGILYTPEILGRIDELRSNKIVLDDLDHYNMSIPAELNVSALIDRFQSNKQELALVTDEGSVIGMVTLTDAFEVIVGSAEDPIDEEEGDPNNH